MYIYCIIYNICGFILKEQSLINWIVFKYAKLLQN